MRTMRITACALLLGLAAGCGGERREAASPPAAGPSWPSAEERTLRPDHAPTPFTAEQIRAGCPSGRVATFRFEAEGGRRGFLVFRFAEADEEGVSFVLETLDEKRAPVGEPRRSRATWKELQGHASFPAARTQVHDEVVAVPAGSFACLVYEVRDAEGDGQVVRRYAFARDLPGMPIRLVETRDGREVSRQELLSNEG